MLQEKPNANKIKTGVQIIFDRGNHWIVAANIHDDGTGAVKVYDSLYNCIDSKSKGVVKNLFETTAADISVVNMQKQHGSTDCGLFAIAVVTALLFGEDPSSLHFEQSCMRNHLLQCYIKQNFAKFS